MNIAVNQLLATSDKEEFYRVVWVDSVNSCCYLKNTIKSTFPFCYEENDIKELLESGEWIHVEHDPYIITVDEEDLSENERRRRDRAYDVVCSIYQEPDVFIPTLRRRLIKLASSRFNVSEKTVVNYLNKYWNGGMTKSSLLPNFKSDKKAKPRKYNRKTGRPNVYHSSIPRENVSDKWKKIFQKALEKHYYNRKKASLKHAYQQMLKENFSITDESTGYQVLNVEWAIPSYDQFYYWYRKWHVYDYAVRKREGIRQYNQNYRPILGSSTEDAKTIGLYAVDATVGDIYLVSSIDRQKIIGRPIIYLVVDVYSRCIVGLSVSIENMSSETLRMALANTFDDKSFYLNQVLDMNVESEAWPVQHVPHTLLTDRGSELLSDQLSQLVEELQIKIQNVGAYRAELKGVCEQYFNILQNHIKPFLPGSVYKDAYERGSKDYRKEAVLNLKEYMSILVRCVMYYNNHHFMNEYPLTPAMKQDGVRSIPIEIFQWGLSKSNGQLRVLSNNQIKGVVYPKSKATVTAKGLLFNTLYYVSKVALDEKWFAFARTHGSWKVTVSYNPYDVSEIYLHHKRNDYEVCSLVEQYASYKDATQEEIDAFRQDVKQQATEFEPEDLDEQIKLAQDIESIVNKAKSEDGPSSKPVDQIKNNRQEEIALNKAVDKPYGNKIDDTVINKGDNPKLDMFRRAKEGLMKDDEE